MNLPEIILSRFAGRPDYIAVADASGGFHPEMVSPTTDHIVKHVNGDQCYGFYLLDKENRCRLTCMDFDNHPDKPNPKWKDQAELTFAALTSFGLSPLLELSQSGSGAHVWIFFDEPAPAWMPRAWWRVLLRRLGITGLECYPRQDELTGKGLGNLVRYPLWNKSRFVDPEGEWKELPSPAAMLDARTTSGTDLAMLAFQNGLGELKADPKTTLTAIDTFGDVIPARVAKLLEKKGTLLHRRWSGDMVGINDKSNSAVAQSIACELVRQYVPTPEIASSLRVWCRQNGAEGKGDRDDWVARTVATAYDFTIERSETKSLDVMTFREACHAYLDIIETGKQQCYGSGISELDESIEGIAEGEVMVVAARPSHGKSAFAFQYIDHNAKAGVSCLIISEEMCSSQIGKRRLSSIVSVPQSQWVPASVARMREEVEKYHGLSAPVYILEGVGTTERAVEVIDQFCQLHSVGLIAVDYLQLLGGRGERYEVVTNASREIKKVTQRNGIRTLLLSQLNRAVENRDDNEPNLSDLRESGGIEQDADLVVFLQYPCRFDAAMPKDLYRIHCAKRRNGPIHSPRIETYFDAERQVIGYSAKPDPDVPEL